MDSHAGVFFAIFIASLIIISGAFDYKPKPENYIREFKDMNNHGDIGVCFQIDDKKVTCNFD